MYLWSVLLVSLPAVWAALHCPEQCACSDGEELKYSCDEDNTTIEIAAQPGRYVNIDCQGGRLLCPLPALPAASSLSLRSCRAPRAGCRGSLPRVKTLTVLDARAPLALPWTALQLSSLAIYTTEPVDVPTEALPTLRSFRLSGSHVTLVPGMWSTADQLEYLELSADGIQDIPDDAFVGLTRLEQLNLFGNNISTLRPGAFQSLSSLHHLSLSTSNVQRLEEGVFSSVPLLRSFTMLRANMTLLPDVFRELLRLEKVSISNDVPLSVPQLSSPSLLSLSLSRCRLSSSPSLSTPQLRNLSLSHNQLTRLPVLSSLGELRRLDIDDNLIAELTDDVFYNVTKLEYVSMSQNRLHYISSNAFRGATHIHYLSLSHNLLSFEEEQGQDTYANIYPLQSPLNSLRELTHLDLNHNVIRQIFQDWGNVLLQLKELDLSWNSFERITSPEIQFISLGTIVDLRYNNISSISLEEGTLMEGEGDPGGWGDLAGRGEILFSNNPLNCDCQMYGLLKRLQGAVPMATELKPNAPDAKCSSPSELKGHLLQDLDPISLTCPSPECPNNCTCQYRPAAKVADLDCFSFKPVALKDLGIQKLWLRLRKPPPKLDLLDSVQVLNLTGLGLTEVPTGLPPDSLQLIDLSDNLLQEIPYQLLRYNVSILLAKNPIECCDVNELQGIMDADQMLCNICENKAAVITAGSVLILVVFVVGVGTVVAVKWQREAKVWLAARGWFAKEEDLGTEPYDAFVSFAHGDEEWVRYKLVPALEQEWRVCVHYRDWAVGELIPAQIAKSVTGAKRTLAVVSKHFIQSQWAKLEFRAAAQRALAERRPRLLVLLLDDTLSKDTSIDPELKAYIATSTYLSGSDPNFWGKLRRAMPPPRGNSSPLPLPSGTLNVALTPDGKLVNINDKLRK